MKKFLALVLVLVCALAVLPVSALTKNGSFGEVPLYKGGITVDGKMDAAYSKGLKVDCSLDYNDTYKTDTTADIYLLHDGSYLYYFINVKSANALGDYNQAYAKDKMWSTTCVELMIDWSNDATKQEEIYKVMAWYTGEIYGGFLGLNKENDWVVEHKATVDKAAKTFTIEMKLKFQEGAKTGSEIGLNCMVDSDTAMGANSTAKRQICCTLPGISNPGQSFKNVTLSSKEVKIETTAATTKAAATAAAAKTTAAAKTADMSVVIAAVATVALAGVVVCKKKH